MFNAQTQGEKMTAKKYLEQLQRMQVFIRQLEQEIIDLQEMATATGAIEYDREPVQTSSTGDARQMSLVNTYIELESECRSNIIEYVRTKARIINEIHKLPDRRYIELLNLRYVPDIRGRVKSLEEIACEMRKTNGDSYSYDHIVSLHGEALESFTNTILASKEVDK